MSEVYIFWDHSNMFISAKKAAMDREGVFAQDTVRLNFANLMRLAAALRTVKKAYAVGSIPPDQKALWDRLAADTGINIELFERGAQTGTEQGVDQSLQIHMLRAGDDEKQPKVAVLLTGDGKGFEAGRGFLADLKRLHDKGWGVEVLSWEHSCKQELKKFAEEKGEFISLDNYYDSITFLERTRDSATLSLTSRKKARPGRSPEEIQQAIIDELQQKLEAAKAKKQRQKDYGERVHSRNARK